MRLRLILEILAAVAVAAVISVQLLTGLLFLTVTGNTAALISRISVRIPATLFAARSTALRSANEFT